MNKKSEGRVSSWIIVLIIGLSLMIGFSTLLSEMVTTYGKETVSDFDAYQEDYNNMVTAVETLTASNQNTTLQFEDSDTFEDVLYKKAYNFVNPLWQKITYIPSKIVGGVNVVLATGGMMTSSINNLGETKIGLDIPPFIKVIALSLIGISIVIMGFSVFMKWKL